MKRTNIYLDEEQTASLDKLAAQEGVSRAELIRLLLNRALTTAGDDTAERREVWRLLASFRVQPATEVIARRAGDMMRRYRRSHNRIGLGDYLIAATADVQDLQLATLNVWHFPMFEQLKPPFAVPGHRPRA